MTISMKRIRGMGAARLAAIASAIGCAALSSGPLQADGGDPGWAKETTDKGCFLYEYSNYFWQKDNPPGFVWTGPCTPGQPITGEGTLYVQHRIDADKFYFIRSLTGRLVNGLFEGQVKIQVYEVGGDGSWDPSAGMPDFNPVWQHSRGCPE